MHARVRMLGRQHTTRYDNFVRALRGVDRSTRSPPGQSEPLQLGDQWAINGRSMALLCWRGASFVVLLKPPWGPNIFSTRRAVLPRVSISWAQVQQLPKTHSATIPADYLDDMGHMNVMWYTHLCSLGMAGTLEQAGLAWSELAEHGGGTFALEQHTTYLSEVRVGQTVELHGRVIARTEKRYHIMQFMTNREKQDVAAVFEAVGAYVDLRIRRMAPLPDRVRDRLDQMIAEQDRLDWSAPVCGAMAP